MDMLEIFVYLLQEAQGEVEGAATFAQAPFAQAPFAQAPFAQGEHCPRRPLPKETFAQVELCPSRFLPKCPYCPSALIAQVSLLPK